MITDMSTQLEKAYKHCMDLTRSHYENFPVASLALPAEMRRPVSVIYAFARTADDIADEGDTPAETRLQQLQEYDHRLDSIRDGETQDDLIFLALADVIRTHNLPIDLFYDLVKAFSMDVTVKRYADFNQLMQYCRHSANPVGRLLLYLAGEAGARNLEDSDKICSALQLINFLQDIQQDYHESGRIYLPQDDLRRFLVNEQMIADKVSSPAMRELVMFEARRAGGLLLSGAALGSRLAGRFGFEIRMIVLGGMRIASMLMAQDEDVFTRPRLSRKQRLSIFSGALSKGKYTRSMLPDRLPGLTYDA
jgi:squalene synthase HpnC